MICCTAQMSLFNFKAQNCTALVHYTDVMICSGHARAGAHKIIYYIMYIIILPRLAARAARVWTIIYLLIGSMDRIRWIRILYFLGVRATALH